MKQIFGQDALQIQPSQTGFIFVIKQEERDEKAVVAYKMLDFERMTLSPVTRKVYLLSKFGNQFQRFDDNPDDFLHIRSLFLPDHRLLTVDSKGEATVFATDSRTDWKGDLSYNGCAPHSLVAGEAGFFASYPDAGAVIRYGGTSLRSEMRIGGGDGLLPRPEGLYYEHEQLLICAPTQQKILRLNPVTFEIEEYYSFEEPVHRYVKYHANEIVQLDSGIYKL